MWSLEKVSSIAMPGSPFACLTTALQAGQAAEKQGLAGFTVSHARVFRQSPKSSQLLRLTRCPALAPRFRLCREEDGRGLFGKYPHLKKLHHARTNLAVTSQLSEFFYTIPQRAEGLIK